GKKGSAARPSREDAQDDFDEAMSTTSWDTNDTYGSAIDNGGQQESYYINGGGARSDTGSVADVGESKAVDDFKDAVELLTEKRASTRQSGLKTVMKFMLHSPDLGPVLAMQETILQALIGVLRRKGTEVEGVHALRALSVLCVCIGPEEEDTFKALRRPLRTIITRSKHLGVRVGAVHTLALACFICSSDDDNTSETLDLLAEVFGRTSDGLDVPDELVAAALSGWGLLATTVSRAWVATRMTIQHLKLFRDLLGSNDMDVRIEAGENLALLYESRLILGLAGTEGALEEGEEEDIVEDDDGDGGGGDGGEEAVEDDAVDLTVLWEEVVEEMKGFITDSSKKVT
ncbi:unnamed protein product, partial [Sphacelaria rigidula]